ncbi:structural constituent of cell wall [Ceratobasidium sp. AG-Ba]|nr:structural constituent of cell wall [Ceratobasidium sp. AG-Ba]
MPAQEPNRQELMNAGPHHAKLRVTAHVAAAVHVAGTDVAGKIDVECRAEKGLGLGTIMVELMAIQELNSRDHAATSTFIHTRRIFQGPGLPPSNAVVAEDESGAFPPHHYPARRGITTFFFRFPLPLTSPASIEFGSGLARIRYEIRASASVAWKGERRLVTDRQDIQVVESATQEVEPAGTVVGESGKVWMQAKVLGGAVMAGQTCCIELHVKNHSSRKTTGVNVSLRRVLHLDNPPPQHANILISDTLVTAPFNTAEYCCPPGVDGVAKLVINVPRTARTVKGGSRESGEAGSDKSIPALFDVRGSITVRLCMGVGAKDLSLELPVVISHPAAIPPEPPLLGPPTQDLTVGRPTSPYAPYEPPRSPFAPPHSPVQPYHTGYSPYPPSSPVPYTQVYFPPMSPQPPNILNYFPAPPTSPTLPMSPGPIMSPALPFGPAPPFTPIIPPSTYHNAPYPYPPHSPGPSRSPAPLHSPNIPQFAHTQSMPQLGPPQSPQRYDGLPSRGPLPPLPPRPTSAEPHVHQVAVDLPPPAGASSPTAARIFPPLEAKYDADGVEGKGARASRISEHLRMSSRTRSVSPTGRRFAGARPRPSQAPPPQPAGDAPMEHPSPHSLISPLPEENRRARSSSRGTGQSELPSPRAGIEGDAIKTSTDKPRLEGSNKPDGQQAAAHPETHHQRMDKQRVREKVLPRLPPSICNDPVATPPGDSSPTTAPRSGDSQEGISTSPIAKPVTDPAPILKPLQPVPTGLTALERRLTTRIELPLPAQKIREPDRKPEPTSPNPKPDSGKTIDWGEIARIGKLKSFALERKKPAVTSFTPPALPLSLFDKPKPEVILVTRKPVPSLEPEERPVNHILPPASRPPSLPPTNHDPTPPAPTPPASSSSGPELRHLVRYQLSDPPVSKPPTNPAPTNQSATRATQSQQTVARSRPTSFPHVTVNHSSTALPQPSMPPKPASPRPSSAAGPSNDAQWPEPQQNQDPPQSTTKQTSLPERPVAGPPIKQPQTSTVVKQPDRSSTVPVAPVILRAPKHAIRYQLADPPVPKLQPIPKSDPTNLGAPLNSVPNYRAVLKPVSAPRPASPIKPIPPRINQKGMSDQAATISVPPPSNPLSKTNTPMSTSVTLPELGPGPEPRSLTQRDTRSASQPSVPLPRRSHSPQRPRPQAQSQPQPVGPERNKPVVRNYSQPSEPRRVSAESQAAQKARYFESLAAGNGPSSPTKPNLASVPLRRPLQPQEGITPQQRKESTRSVRSQPPAVALPTPGSPQILPVVTNPLIEREDTGPRFTAMPVPPTAPTARSLIPVTSSGFEVPVILPGNDARERADAALREAELFRLKREAMSRVPMWLNSDTVPQPPPPTRVIPRPTHEIAAYANWDLQLSKDEEPTMATYFSSQAELLAGVDKPATRAVYDPQLKHPRPRPMASKSAAALMPNDTELLAKYDLRSARGGKGGQVTSVAAIWQNVAAGLPVQQHGPSTETKVISQPDRTTPASPLLNGLQTAVKSASVTTMVYPATGVPILSSTTSLARPIGEVGARVRQMTFPSSIPESQSDDVLVRRTSQPTQNVAVGQARLKELIGRYQS